MGFGGNTHPHPHTHVWGGFTKNKNIKTKKRVLPINRAPLAFIMKKLTKIYFAAHNSATHEKKYIYKNTLQHVIFETVQLIF